MLPAFLPRFWLSTQVQSRLSLVQRWHLLVWGSVGMHRALSSLQRLQASLGADFARLLPSGELLSCSSSSEPSAACADPEPARVLAKGRSELAGAGLGSAWGPLPLGEGSNMGTKHNQGIK